MERLKSVWALFDKLQGKRTQILMGLFALVQALELTGVLTMEQAASLKDVLLPLAGATFAAKVSSVGQAAKQVISKPD